MVLKKHLLFLLVSCRRMILALCLILLGLHSGRLGVARLYDKNLGIPQSQFRIHLRNWGVLGMVIG